MSLIERRRFLGATSALAALLAASPSLVVGARQSSGRPYRIALVPDFHPDWAKRYLKILTDSLGESGRIEGRDYVIYRSGVSYGQNTKLAVDRAMEAKPDLIIVANQGYAIDVRKRTKTVPIVMWISGFPMAGGLAKSLARPGMNVTGLTVYGGGEFFGKLLDLLHQAKPSVKRVGFLMSYVPPFHTRAETDLIIKSIRDAAEALGIDLRTFEIATSGQVDEALPWATAQGLGALVLTSDPSLYARREEVMEFAVANRLLTIADATPWYGVKPEPVLIYWASPRLLLQQVGPFVERILWDGARPGDLPIQLPTRYRFKVNLKTAEAIGLLIPQRLLIQADEVIR
jgi:putative ABC transport system substrate-binding protein